MFRFYFRFSVAYEYFLFSFTRTISQEMRSNLLFFREVTLAAPNCDGISDGCTKEIGARRVKGRNRHGHWFSEGLSNVCVVFGFGSLKRHVEYSEEAMWNRKLSEEPDFEFMSTLGSF